MFPIKIESIETRAASRSMYNLHNKRISYGYLDETGDKIFSLFGNVHDPKQIELRIQQLSEIYGQKIDDSYNSLIHYRDLSGPKMDGAVLRKDDFRLDEVTLAGKRAIPLGYQEVPMHPQQIHLIRKLGLVKKGLLTIEKIQELLTFIQNGGNGVWSALFPDTGLNRSHKKNLKNIVEQLVGRQMRVSWDCSKLCVRHNPPKPFVNFILTSTRSQKTLEKPPWLYASEPPRQMYSNVFAEAYKTEPAAIMRFSNFTSTFTFSDTSTVKSVQTKVKGHMFRFAIRNIKNSEKDITKLMTTFAAKGYINYFNVIPAHSNLINAGKNFALNQLQEGVDALLQPCAGTRLIKQELLKALFFVFRDARPLSELKFNTEVPLQKVFKEIARERALNLQSTLSILQQPDMNILAECGNYFVNLIWNQTVNMVIDRRGSTKLRVGDLVFTSKASENRVLHENVVNVDEKPVKLLTEADINSGNYKDFDLVIPVCGFGVMWPQSDIGQYIDEVLRQHGIKNKEYFEESHVSELPFVFQGTYRKVLTKPENLKWWTKKSKHDESPLVLGGMSRRVVKKIMAEEACKRRNVKSNPQKALVVEFFVPRKTHLSAPMRELFNAKDLGDAVLYCMDDINEFSKTSAELSEKVLTSLDEYSGEIAKNPEPTDKEALENALKRVSELERELAILQKEREMNEQAVESRPNPSCKIPINSDHPHNQLNCGKRANSDENNNLPAPKRLALGLFESDEDTSIETKDMENDSSKDIQMLSQPNLVQASQVDMYEDFKQFLLPKK